ncbi:MAG: SDR family oxidoreductase [Myxococcota bacterium]|jgi:3-oxoacyl-[acyl-carrier protein] reductase|nr:SDR family oxidoreductase [Myxococcota bacterium]
MKLGLEGKRAVVGGASRGLGFAVAEALLAEGAQVVIAARDEDNLELAARLLEARTGFPPIPIAADLTSVDSRQGLVERTMEQLGGIDILIANAGGPPPGPFLSHGLENWQLAIDLALGSVTHLCRLVIPSMMAQGFGRIVQIVSIAGLEAIDGLILSNASRPAVLGFAKALAREMASHNILVNSICPGVFMTDRMTQLAKERATTRGIKVEEYLDEFSSDIPLGRPGNPREVGDLAVFLASPRNSYITGAAIPIDGGKTRRLY